MRTDKEDTFISSWRIDILPIQTRPSSRHTHAPSVVSITPQIQVGNEAMVSHTACERTLSFLFGRADLCPGWLPPDALLLSSTPTFGPGV